MNLAAFFVSLWHTLFSAQFLTKAAGAMQVAAIYFPHATGLQEAALALASAAGGAVHSESKKDSNAKAQTAATPN